MSDKPISAGDLVQVVRGHECDIGWIFHVASIQEWPHAWHCRHCNASAQTDVIQWANAPRGDRGHGCPVSWLRRIPPLSDLTGTSEDARKPVKETA